MLEKTRAERRICFITGTRAEYGIMSSLMKLLRDTEGVRLQIIATNMHLSARHGMTVREIEADGFQIDARVAMPEADGSPESTVASMGVELQGLAGALARLNPDMVVILGDRYEMLAAASAALIMGVPIAHLYGGETTEGAYDDAIRHAITKLSRLHFTSTEKYRQRIIRMGEAPDTVHWVGALGADNITRERIMSRAELEASLGFETGDDFLLATFHPVTLEPGEEAVQTRALLEALEEVAGSHKVLFTMPNADTGGATIAAMIEQWGARMGPRVHIVKSLGRERYYSALAHCAAVVGNSSSGLTEAPTLGVPTLDIGNRQKGREAGATVVHCEPEFRSIRQGLAKVLDSGFRDFCRKHPDNPYRCPGTLQAIARILTRTPLPLPPKQFYE